MSAEIKRTADLTDNDYARAVAIITGDNNASTSYLQRTMQLGYNAADSLIERAEAEGIVSRPNAAGNREVTPAASTIAAITAITAQLAEARAMARAAREQTIAALHGPLWRAILQTEDCMNRVCSYRTEAGGCLCGPKIDRIEAHVRTLDPDAAAAIAERDAENARLTARAEAAEAMADQLAEVMNDIRDYATILASDGQHRVLREALAAYAAMKEGTSTLSPIAAAARVLLAQTEAANDPEIGPWLSALAEQEKADE